MRVRGFNNSRNYLFQKDTIPILIFFVMALTLVVPASCELVEIILYKSQPCISSTFWDSGVSWWKVVGEKEKEQQEEQDEEDVWSSSIAKSTS